MSTEQEAKFNRSEYMKAYRKANKERLAAYQTERYHRLRGTKPRVQSPDAKEKARARDRAAYEKRAEAKRALEAVTGVVKLKQKALSVTGLRASTYAKIASIFDQLGDRFCASEVGRLAGIDYQSAMMKVILEQTFKCWQTASGIWRKP